MKQQIKKAVLAYSGGLDSSIIIPWLKENYGCEVLAMVGNIGQEDQLEGLEEKALKAGASKVFVEDLRNPFVTEYLWPLTVSLNPFVWTGRPGITAIFSVSRTRSSSMTGIGSLH